MFGGKKLKDLTEEDIRAYAASLASGGSGGGDAEAADKDGEAEPLPAAAAAAATPGGEAAADADVSDKAHQVGAAGDAPELERALELDGLQLELARRRREEEEAQRVQRHAELEEERLKRISEEERLREEVLGQLDRSQMPAVRTGDGVLQKTIEHYTFADSEDVASISIDLDRDLFEGAAALLVEEGVEVSTRESEVTIVLHRLPASKTVAALAEWRLHIVPLFHSVEPDQTTWRIRKGKLSVKLVKRKRQEWRRLVKF